MLAVGLWVRVLPPFQKILYVLHVHSVFAVQHEELSQEVNKWEHFKQFGVGHFEVDVPHEARLDGYVVGKVQPAGSLVSENQLVAANLAHPVDFSALN